ncbi:MAG: aldo/keto reductase [Saprospiraceae bacterium]|nr:aldo/keto reductase [Saprospiraceae bacterium]
MEYRYMGKTGLQLSALSLGSWLTFGKQIEDVVAERLMAIAYERGVNFFDNAEIYARGQSEIVMGKILKKLNWDRSTYVVSSKVFFGDGGKLPNQTGLSRKHVFEACDAALKRLQVEYLDLFYCHRPDPNTPIAETVWAMNHLISQGKIFYWGTSEWSAQQIMEAHMVAKEYQLIGPTVEQPQYNMLHRDKMEVEFLPIFRGIGMGTTIWSPLASGLLTRKYLDKYPPNTRLSIEGMEWLKERNLTPERIQKVVAISQLADNLDVSLPRLGIAWCLVNPNVTSVILGASKEEQLVETLTSIEVMPLLTVEVLQQLETILDNKPTVPAF